LANGSARDSRRPATALAVAVGRRFSGQREAAAAAVGGDDGRLCASLPLANGEGV